MLIVISKWSLCWRHFVMTHYVLHNISVLASWRLKTFEDIISDQTLFPSSEWCSISMAQRKWHEEAVLFWHGATRCGEVGKGELLHQEMPRVSTSLSCPSKIIHATGFKGRGWVVASRETSRVTALGCPSTRRSKRREKSGKLSHASRTTLF